MLKLFVCLLALVAFTEAKTNFKERLRDFFVQVSKNETLLKMYREHEQQYIEARERFMHHRNRTGRAVSTFQCLATYPLNLQPSSSVHTLRPEHVSVVAAMGDSLTAGNGILGNNILDCLTEYRGRSWSIGGDLNFAQGVETLPNILKEFNPHLHGYSLGKCDETNYACSQLNVAVAGETSQDMPDQARDLVSRLTNPNFGVDLMNEWKVITVFIGGNDLCDICNNYNIHQPSSYLAKVEEALDILHQNIPKAFINLVQIFDITPLARVSQGFFCNLITQSVCGCAKNVNNNAMLQGASHEYQAGLQRLVDSGKYDTRDDFTVVLQPFFEDTEPVRDHSGGYDLAYFAPDCFHFSDLGANAAGKSLWNNMIEPVGSKKREWHLNEAFHCPHTNFQADSVFRTKKN
ncbi:phospholipase B1, membrane-associated-like isoform X2 [Ruditapes philippinarum]|uniref:phospholipase B1, membrane-associated-like isoform X1 n=1 Tax=Ruditapes philippinarum TaxID=129788 RepID=UPI00295B2454|nr:phospholipase B1, membrane-associated-like isoform X1 [Ruditapes philippinarum]XP_060552279.1 phospholipase B1, membrane-associated-like isoform X2 [Ruditapes philippinarum]